MLQQSNVCCKKVSPNRRFRYHLTVDTFHLTVTLIDRYLATTVINSKEQNPQKHFCVQASLFTLGANLQCVGVAAMMIASKFEEIYPPTIHDFV